MTTEKLRDLLHEQVSDVTMTDLSASAWREGVRIRRRRAVAVVGGTAAAALAVTAGVSVLGDDPVRGPGRPATSGPTPTPTESGEPDTTYAGAPVWVAPPLAEEAGLPRLDGTGLPAEIDLSPGAPSAAGIGRAVGVLGVWPDGDLSRVVAVGVDGGSYGVGIGGVLQEVRDEQGNVISALTQDSLAPDGRHAFFVQERSLEVYDFQTGGWTRIETPPWLAEGARWVDAGKLWVPARLGGTTGTWYDILTGEPQGELVFREPGAWPDGDDPTFGPWKASRDGVAQSRFLAEPVAVDGTAYAGLDAVVATRGGALPHLLVFRPLEERWKGCCPVVGWSDADHVLMESRTADARVLAWRVGTHDVRQVSRIVGWVAGQESYVASWSLLGL